MAGLFGAFVFLQFTVLALANHAGEGFLATEQRELVYYGLQVFVILGYLLHAVFARLCTGSRVHEGVTYAVLTALFACVAAMLVFGTASLANVVISLLAVLGIGWIGGATHLRMSLQSVSGARVAKGIKAHWKCLDCGMLFADEDCQTPTTLEELSIPALGGNSGGGGGSSVVATVQMWRLYNPNSGEHFYTASSGERDKLVALGWKDEGNAWKAPKKSSVPVYRLYNPISGDHHYTMSAGERDLLVVLGWNDEGVGFYGVAS